ncbi:MAG: hypothetical protein SNH73_07345 [Rikenellaceae bacterium]
MTKLLIVSSDSLYTKVISTALQGPQVEIAHIDPSQCLLEKCQNYHTELIIFLSLAPYFTSMNIIEHLREVLTEMPAIYVIAHSHSQSTILSLLECGVTQYMTFPINLYRLRNKVYTLLSHN